MHFLGILWLFFMISATVVCDEKIHPTLAYDRESVDNILLTFEKKLNNLQLLVDKQGSQIYQMDLKIRQQENVIRELRKDRLAKCKTSIYKPEKEDIKTSLTDHGEKNYGVPRKNDVFTNMTKHEDKKESPIESDRAGTRTCMYTVITFDSYPHVTDITFAIKFGNSHYFSS